MIGPTVLFSEMTPDPSWEDRFNTWYDTDHIPVRMVLDGWHGVQRYRASDNAGDYLVVYDMRSTEVLKTPEYEVIKTDPSDETKWMLSNVSNFTRYIGKELGRHGDLEAAITAPLIFTAMFNVPEEDEEEFDTWMVEDHIPLLMGCDDWLAVRRFTLPISEPETYTRLAIHYLASPDALSSPERAAARDTDFRERMTRHDWFGKGRYRGYEAFGDRVPGQAG
ncbi:hypothetical protein [Salipiger abyssi]|uniref:hypothetical protein n=1 Tax=Salipiger abyssi TaxID=1250539 RepID=UPI004059832E